MDGKKRRIRITFQDVVIEEIDEYRTLVHMFIYYDKGKRWELLDSVFDDDDRLEILSCYIANCLNDYPTMIDRFYIDGNVKCYDCECCGDFWITTTTITDTKSNKQIEIVEDGHMGGGTRGFLHEEIIEDWNYLGYELDIIRR